MKRYGNLFDKITSFENILAASIKARKGKRYKTSTALFECDLEKNIFRIIDALKNKTYMPGAYNDFYIYEPKKRLISAAPYIDRVVHHALISVIGSIIEKSFIYDSYSCLKGKGTHKAVLRYKEFLKHNTFVMKCDIRKYFFNIDHVILFKKLSDKIKCQDTLWLCRLIIDSRHCEDYYEPFPGDDLMTPLFRKKGIPIGNLTSQFFSNLYLNDFDHYVKEQLGVLYYIRYCDDFVIFGNSKKWLNEVKVNIITYLETERLTLHASKSRIFRVVDGVDFLGYRIYPNHSRVRKSIVQKYRRKTGEMRQQFAAGAANPEKILCSMQSWIGHVQHADSFTLIRDLFYDLYLLLQKKGIESNSLAGRLVEQRCR